MPPKNKTKLYGENVFYHAYNRGYNKQALFHDNHDYNCFLYLIQKYLEPGFREKRFTLKGEEYFVEPNHVYHEVDLLAYCLMPNHFHLLLFQKTLKGMPKLISRLATSYATYYNKKYQTQGSPFQDTYKAVIVRTEEQLTHLSRYIHINPSEIINGQPLESYRYSSYPFYLNPNNRPAWIKPEKILNSFASSQSYRSFVEDYFKAQPEERTKSPEGFKDLLLKGVIL